MQLYLLPSFSFLSPLSLPLTCGLRLGCSGVLNLGLLEVLGCVGNTVLLLSIFGTGRGGTVDTLLLLLRYLLSSIGGAVSLGF